MTLPPIGALISGMPRLRLSIPILAFALLASACTSSDDASPNTSTTDSTASETTVVDAGIDDDGDAVVEPEPVEADTGIGSFTFDDGACPVDVPGLEPRCGTVTVPMNWSDGSGEVVLPVVVLPATDGAEHPPVVYLEGGPGGHPIETLPFQYASLFEGINVGRDVILFDQRGVGFAEPSLACDAIFQLADRLRGDASITPEAGTELAIRTLGDCSDAWIADGIDLTQYNSVASAHDAEAIRTALEIEQWDLFGISYGTRLGLEIMRQHPEGVRSAVLDSVLPPDADLGADGARGFVESLEAVDAACDAEAECDAAGDLDQRLRDAYAALEAEPRTIEVPDAFNPFGPPTIVEFDGDALAGLTLGALYSPVRFGDLPELLADLEAGGTDAAAGFLTIELANEGFFTPGLLWAVECHEAIPFGDPTAVDVPADPFGDRPDSTYLFSNFGPAATDYCAAVPSGQADPSIFAPVSSDIPSLVLAGRFDPVTPVAWGEQAAATLSSSQVVVVEDQGHAVTGSPCGQDLLLAFLDAPGPIDADCADDDIARFLAPDPDPLVFEAFEVDVPDFGVTIAGVRPEGWTVDATGIQSLRLDGILDETSILQLGFPSSVGGLLEDQVLGQFDLELGSESTVETPAGAWRRRDAGDEALSVVWYDRELGGGLRALVAVFADPADVDELAARVEAELLPVNRVSAG